MTLVRLTFWSAPRKLLEAKRQKVNINWRPASLQIRCDAAGWKLSCSSLLLKDLLKQISHLIHRAMTKQQRTFCSWSQATRLWNKGLVKQLFSSSHDDMIKCLLVDDRRKRNNWFDSQRGPFRRPHFTDIAKRHQKQMDLHLLVRVDSWNTEMEGDSYGTRPNTYLVQHLVSGAGQPDA